MPATVKLSRTIRVIDRDFAELTLRDPVGGDLAAAGYPMRFTGKGATEIDADATATLIARLAGVPRTAVDALPIADWQACMVVITAFLGAGATAPTSSTAISTPAAGGAISSTS
jgi:hypothetical protein